MAIKKQYDKPLVITELETYSMFALKSGSGIEKGTPKLMISVIGTSLVRITVFANDAGNNEIISFSFYTRQLEVGFKQIMKDLREKKTDCNYVIGSSKQFVNDQGNEIELSAQLMIGSNAKGICWLKLSIEGKPEVVFPFTPIRGSSFVAHGKDMAPSDISRTICLTWMSGILSSASRIQSMLQFKYAKVIDNSSGVASDGNSKSNKTNPPANFDDLDNSIPY